VQCVFGVCGNAVQANDHPDGDRELYLWSLSSQAECVWHVSINNSLNLLAGIWAFNPLSIEQDEVNVFSKHFEPIFFSFLFYVLTSDAGPHMIQSLGILQRKALLGTSVPTDTSANCTCTRALIGAMGVQPRSYLELKASDASTADTTSARLVCSTIPTPHHLFSKMP
jgi:hypothetical protein